MRADYVEGIPGDGGRVHWPTHDELATRYGRHADTVRKRAARDRWSEQRATWQRRVEQQRQEERAGEIARIAADLDLTAVQLARDGLTITRARIQELGLLAQQRVQQIAQGADPRVVGAVDSLEMDRLARAADTWYLLGLKAIGQTPPIPLELQLPGEVDADERDADAIGVLAILREHLPHMVPEGMEVIDVNSRLRLVAGDVPAGDPPGVDATYERVHPADADD